MSFPHSLAGVSNMPGYFVEWSVGLAPRVAVVARNEIPPWKACSPSAIYWCCCIHGEVGIAVVGY